MDINEQHLHNATDPPEYFMPNLQEAQEDYYGHQSIGKVGIGGKRNRQNLVQIRRKLSGATDPGIHGLKEWQ